MPITFSFGEGPLELPSALEEEIEPRPPGPIEKRHRAFRPRERRHFVDQCINTAISAAGEARRYFQRRNFHQVAVHLEHAQWQISRALSRLPRVID